MNERDRLLNLDILCPPAIVQAKKKYATFTLREVTFAEVLEHRKKMEAREAELRAEAAARDARIAAFRSSIGAQAEGARLAGRDTEAWDNKLKAAKELQENYMKPELLDFKPQKYDPIPEPKKTFSQRVRAFVRRFWEAANF